MKIFHTTSLSAAHSIVNEGFRDGEGTYGTGKIHKGVFFSDSVAGPGDFGWELKEEPDRVFVINVPEEDISQYEWKQEHGAREWCVPAKVINRYFVDRTVFHLDDPLLYKK